MGKGFSSRSAHPLSALSRVAYAMRPSHSRLVVGKDLLRAINALAVTHVFVAQACIRDGRDRSAVVATRDIGKLVVAIDQVVAVRS